MTIEDEARNVLGTLIVCAGFAIGIVTGGYFSAIARAHTHVAAISFPLADWVGR